MNILRYFGLDVKRCPVCDQNELPGHVCKQSAKWSRRGFLFLLAAAPAVASLPIVPARLSNEILTIEAVTNEALSILASKLQFHRDAFALTWPSIGDTIHIRAPRQVYLPARTSHSVGESR